MTKYCYSWWQYIDIQYSWWQSWIKQTHSMSQCFKLPSLFHITHITHPTFHYLTMFSTSTMFVQTYSVPIWSPSNVPEHLSILLSVNIANWIPITHLHDTSKLHYQATSMVHIPKQHLGPLLEQQYPGRLMNTFYELSVLEFSRKGNIWDNISSFTLIQWRVTAYGSAP